jgi:4-amino-4-deoxy-L-arabinose transferase-like glycosyltransferase/membrane-associated phospholipid phosphatase
VIFHVVCLLSIVLVWLTDRTIFEWCHAWYNGPNPPNGELHQLILSLAMFGQGLGMVLSVVLVALFDRKRKRAALLALMIGLTALASAGVKMIIGRERPLQSKGATVFHGPIGGLVTSRTQSFPSGHTTTAATLATVLSAFYPHARGLFWGLAAGVAVNRVVIVAHYPSDVLAGAWLGYVVSTLLLHHSGVRHIAALAILWAEAFQAWLILQLHRLRDRFRWQPRRLFGNPWLLFAVSLTIHWLGNANTPLWDRDEPRFATAAREMLHRGDWITPTFNGDLRLDKPILVYWLIMSAYSIFGINTFAARFFSGIAGTMTVVVTYFLARSMFGHRVGLVAGWVLALSPMLVVESKITTADALLVSLLTPAAALMWRVACGKGRLLSAVGFWILLGLAGLAKGPVALAVLMSTALVYSAITRSAGWLTRLQPGLGVVILLIIVVPWCWAVQSATNGQFIGPSLQRHVLERSHTPAENHAGFPGYYLVSVLLLMSPWGWALPWAFTRLGRKLFVDQRLAFLTAWVIGPLILFEAVRTKLVHYFLPAYPALAILLSAAWLARFGQEPRGVHRIKPWMGWTIAWVGSMVSAIVVTVGCLKYPQFLAIPGAIAVGLFGVGSLTAGWFLARRNFRTAFQVTAASLAVGLAVACHSFLPLLGHSRPILEVARRLEEHKHDRIAFWMYRDPSLIFNLNGIFPVVDPLRVAPAFEDSRKLASEGSFLCPMTPEQFRMMSADSQLDLRIHECIERWDGSILKNRTVYLVRVSRRMESMASRPDEKTTN